MIPENKGPVILSKNHTDMLNRFLMPRAESSLVLLSNARLGGLEDQGALFQGTYAAYLEGDEIIGVAAHFWNGMVILQAPKNPDGLFHAVTATSGRECAGIAGPYEQVQQVMPGVMEKKSSPALISRDTLYSLDLNNLVRPDLLERSDVTCRHPASDELTAMIDLRIAFMKEIIGKDMRASFNDEARELVGAQHQKNNIWVLETDGAIVATTAFGASVSDMVQVGGVYTLPGYRNRGYGRAVVAGSLLKARGRGIQKAVLFTGMDMPAAQKVYRALGFRPIGEYGLVIF